MVVPTGDPSNATGVLTSWFVTPPGSGFTESVLVAAAAPWPGCWYSATNDDWGTTDDWGTDCACSDG